jgi:amino acid transporter
LEELRPFARKASGLTRTVSAKDALMYNINAMGILFVLPYATWGAGLYVGVDLPETMLIALPMSIPIALLYAYFSAAMPRTGGDYVWNSRSIHPAIGFMSNFLLSTVLIGWIAVEPAWTMQWGIAPILQGIGIVNGDQGLINLAAQVSSPVSVQILGLIYFVAIALTLVRGTKWTFRVQWGMFILIVLGTLAFIVAALPGSSVFQQRFDSMSGTTVSAVINNAVSEGFVTQATVEATFLGAIFSFLNLTGYFFSSFFAGEIKGVQKSQIIAVVGGAIIFSAIMWVCYQAIYLGMGKEFFGAVSYLYMSGSSKYTLPFTAPAAPFPQFLMPYMTSNTVLIFLVGLGFAMAPLAAGLAYIFLITRNIFAWSFDRVVPTKLSSLDRRYNSPYLALILVVALSMVAQALWLYTNWIAYISYGITALFLGSAITGIAGAIFPYRRKDLFEAAPAMVKRRVGGVPVITVLGVLTFAVSVFVAGATLLPAYVGTINYDYVAAIVVTYVVAIAIYFASSSYRRKKIPLELTFKEIPPE